MHSNRGNVLTSLGRYDEALAEFLYITKINRIRPWALYHVGRIYALKNRRQLALDHLGEAGYGSVAVGFIHSYVDGANERGGEDNITVVLVHCEKE